MLELPIKRAVELIKTFTDELPTEILEVPSAATETETGFTVTIPILFAIVLEVALVIALAVVFPRKIEGAPPIKFNDVELTTTLTVVFPP